MSIKPPVQMPDLTLPTVGGGRFDLAQSPRRRSRWSWSIGGLHCPICKTYLRDLHRKLGEFEVLSVRIVAISTDSAERAAQAYRDWGLERITMAFDLGIQQARQWGLYISAAIQEEEPDLFAEPGLFLVRPAGTLYAASIHTMPFAQPTFSDVLAAVKFVRDENYPARGEARERGRACRCWCKPEAEDRQPRRRCVALSRTARGRPIRSVTMQGRRLRREAIHSQQQVSCTGWTRTCSAM